MDQIPWPAVTASGGGWLLLGLAIYGLLSGRWFVSRREADIYIERAVKAENGRDDLIKTVAGMTGVGKLQQKFAELATTPPDGED